MTHREDEQLLFNLRAEVELSCEHKYVIRPGLSKKILVICFMPDQCIVYHYEKIGTFWNHWLVLEDKGSIDTLLEFIARYINENYRD